MKGSIVTIVCRGTSKHGTNWKVTEIENTNKIFPHVYIIERNQGDHDKRYFMIGGFYYDKNQAIDKAKRLFK